MGFLDNIFKDNKKDKQSATNNNLGFPNPFAGQRGNTFGGTGQSLGGQLPGIVIPVVLPNPGPLGIRVEKRPNSEGTAIVNEVVPGSQADQAGVQRGDILCFANSQGQLEMHYDIFLDMAKNNQRPLEFEVRRIPSKPAPSITNTKSAEADHRKQAVIAAAEAREKAHKQKLKPIKSVTKTTLARQQQQQQQQVQTQQQAQESQKALAEAAKAEEAQYAQQLGYNPYETSRATAGQARNATVAAAHGTMQAEKPSTTSTKQDQATNNCKNNNNNNNNNNAQEELPLEVEEALATFYSVHAETPNVLQGTCKILKTLISNATSTKENGLDEASSMKFRKVRLANPKIQQAIVQVEGAMDLLLFAGFQLTQIEDESVLLYPATRTPPGWIATLLDSLQEHMS